jgi:hypothetical protein
VEVKLAMDGLITARRGESYARGEGDSTDADGKPTQLRLRTPMALLLDQPHLALKRDPEKRRRCRKHHTR